jgi:hypothetical protein
MLAACCSGRQRVQSGGGRAVTLPVHSLARSKVTGTILRLKVWFDSTKLLFHIRFEQIGRDGGRHNVEEGGEPEPAVIRKSSPTMVMRAGSCSPDPPRTERELLQAKPISHGSLQPRLVEKIERQLFPRKHSQRRVPGMGHQF